MTAQLEIRPTGDLRSYRVMGELDLSTVGTLLDRLGFVAAHADGDVRLEMAGVTFVDSTGLHALLRLARALPPPHRLILVDAAAPLCRLFELTGLGDVPQIELRPAGWV
jgi:anti-anti-sigma factor